MLWAARLGLMLATLAAVAVPASAQSWPAKPVKIVVPFGPGGPADIYARILGNELSGVLGQQFVIENKAGAGGTIGADVVACVHCETGALIERARKELLARKPEGTLADWEDAHPAVAEALAIRTAAARHGAPRLVDCDLYVTLEPCPMCAGAIVNARIARLVFGCTNPKAGAVVTLYQIPTDPRLNHRVEVVSGVRADECAAELSRFFAALRRGPEYR